MKKLIIIFCMIAVSAAAQTTGTYLKVPSLTTPIGRYAPDSTVVFVKQNYTLYMATTTMTTTSTVQGLIDIGKAVVVGSSYFVQPAGTGTLTVTTISATNGGVTNLTGGTATITTLVLLGTASTQTITASGDISTTGILGVTGVFLADSSLMYGDEYKHSWRPWAIPQVNIPFSYMNLQNIGDISIIAKAGGGQVPVIARDTSGSTAKATISNITTITTENISITAGCITGTAAMRGTASFTTTDTRVSVYIPGATSTNYYHVQPLGADSHTRPVADDFLNTYAVTDSLVVMRAAGTTSGLSFDWIRIK